MHSPRGQKVKGQGHTVTKTVTFARLLETHAATAVVVVVVQELIRRWDGERERLMTTSYQRISKFSASYIVQARAYAH